jgi:hypothetical protein
MTYSRNIVTPTVFTTEDISATAGQLTKTAVINTPTVNCSVAVSAGAVSRTSTVPAGIGSGSALFVQSVLTSTVSVGGMSFASSVQSSPSVIAGSTTFGVVTVEPFSRPYAIQTSTLVFG